MNYYNEHDPAAAAWLRELVRSGQIPKGDVDQRDIQDISPNELTQYTQCHFFAGIGGWSRALQLAGWPEDLPVWTGSCPCQPFSAAGKGDGFADERHLWPAFHHLIKECRPPVVFGEQVASKDGLRWLDLVRNDLEGAGYAFGAADLCAAGLGAPHIRQRLYFVGMVHGFVPGLEGHTGDVCGRSGGEGEAGSASTAGKSGGMAEPSHEQHHGGRYGRPGRRDEHSNCGSVGGMAESDDDGSQDGIDAADGWAAAANSERCGNGGLADGPIDRRREECPHGGWSLERDREEGIPAGSSPGVSDCWTRATDGFWRPADWFLCRDGKWRPVEPGLEPLAFRLPKGMVRSGDPSLPFHPQEARVMRLRGYGNAIVPQLAAEFILATL